MRDDLKPLADAGVLGAERHELVVAIWNGPDGVEHERPPDETRTVVEWHIDGVRLTDPDQIRVLDMWFTDNGETHGNE